MTSETCRCDATCDQPTEICKDIRDINLLIRCICCQDPVECIPVKCNDEMMVAWVPSGVGVPELFFGTTGMEATGSSPFGIREQ